MIINRKRDIMNRNLDIVTSSGVFCVERFDIDLRLLSICLGSEDVFFIKHSKLRTTFSTDIYLIYERIVFYNITVHLHVLNAFTCRCGVCLFR